MKKLIYYALVGLGGLLTGKYLVAPYCYPALAGPEVTCIQDLEQRATTVQFKAEWGTPMRMVNHNTYLMGSSTTDSMTLKMDVGKINAEGDTIYYSWAGELPDRTDTVFSVAGLSPEMRGALVAKAKHDLYCRWLERGKAACIRQAQQDSLDAVVRQYGGRYQPAPDECAEQPEVCQ